MKIISRTIVLVLRNGLRITLGPTKQWRYFQSSNQACSRRAGLKKISAFHEFLFY
jgi:hypothetical protein